MLTQKEIAYLKKEYGTIINYNKVIKEETNLSEDIRIGYLAAVFAIDENLSSSRSLAKLVDDIRESFKELSNS